MKLYVFGNGNINFKDFIFCYATYLRKLVAQPDTQFIICDFRGVDILTMEFLKTETENVSIYHIGDRSRYIPDSFKTKVSRWKFIGGFKTDFERDGRAIENCTHFLAIDFNSDKTRKSGTQRNIEQCLTLGKIDIRTPLANKLLKQEPTSQTVE